MIFFHFAVEVIFTHFHIVDILNISLFEVTGMSKIMKRTTELLTRTFTVVRWSHGVSRTDLT